MVGRDNHFITNLHIDSNPPLAATRNGQPLLELAKSNGNPTKRRDKEMSNGGVGSKVDPMFRLTDPSQGGAIPSFVLSTLPMMHIPGGSPHLTVRDSVRICYTGKKRGPDEKRKTSEVQEESRKSFVLQTSIPFLLAGCGMVAAGILLDNARQWQFLRQMPEALILVPALLGLKGNLEMTLASRLSTMANLGLLDDKRQKLAALVSNVSLVQAQAIVVSLVAALIAIVSYRLEGNPVRERLGEYMAVCLILASILTASVCSLILASLMVGLAILARRFKINPDNIATPLAAATGDTVTLSFLVLFGTLILQVKETFFYINIAVTCSMIASTGLWMYIASREYITLQVLKFGWFAVLMAMLISSGGGYVLRHSVSHFPSIALFQPVINGVGGNLVSVQSSKISTYLHQFGQMGMLPANRLANYLNPLRAFACKEEESVHSAILLLMSIPGHAIFFLVITAIQKDLRFNAPFFALYMFIAIMQVSVLLYICQAMCRIMWLLWINPDNNSIPILTALGDLLGSSLLAAAFYSHSLLNVGRISVSTALYEEQSAYVSENSSFIFAGDLTGSTALTPTAAFTSG